MNDPRLGHKYLQHGLAQEAHTPAVRPVRVPWRPHGGRLAPSWWSRLIVVWRLHGGHVVWLSRGSIHGGRVRALALSWLSWKGCDARADRIVLLCVRGTMGRMC